MIQGCEAQDIEPTTYLIAAMAYAVQPDAEGNRLVSDAQHGATKRALEGLQRTIVSGMPAAAATAGLSFAITGLLIRESPNTYRCCKERQRRFRIQTRMKRLRRSGTRRQLMAWCLRPSTGCDRWPLCGHIEPCH